MYKALGLIPSTTKENICIFFFTPSLRPPKKIMLEAKVVVYIRKQRQQDHKFEASFVYTAKLSKKKSIEI
jgi:hypothetical protein